MYLTLDDLKAVIPEEVIIALTDDGGVGTLGTAELDKAIAGACSEIDSYLSARYPVPLTTVPENIRDIACDITAYRLYKRRQEELSDTRRAAYKDALKVLTDIRDGKQILQIPETTSSSFSCSVAISSHFGGPDA